MSPTTSPLVVVTAATPERTRRWRALIASTGLRVYRPRDLVAPIDLPLVAVHVDDSEAWLAWAQPCDRTATRRRLRQRQRAAEKMLNARGRPPAEVARIRILAEAMFAWCAAGFGVPGHPGDAGWIEIHENGSAPDWRCMAEAVHLAVHRAYKKGDLAA